jgi:mutual gliding-motility protein MglA
MVLFNYSTKELTAKVVYYGPGLCGKTTNLQWIHEKLPIRNKGKMLSLATETDRTLFFDFLPIELGSIRGMKTRIQLYTVPGQVFYNATRRMVLKGADGVVFVCDSQEAMIDANLESLENLKENLVINEIDPDTVPIVLQYNKRDLPNAAPIEILNERLNPKGWPHFEAMALKGVGVEETLKGITAVVFRMLSTKYGGVSGPSTTPTPPPPAPPPPVVVKPTPPPPPPPPPRAPEPIPEPEPLELSTGGADDLLDEFDTTEPVPEPQVMEDLHLQPEGDPELQLDMTSADPMQGLPTDELTLDEEPAPSSAHPNATLMADVDETAALRASIASGNGGAADEFPMDPVDELSMPAAEPELAMPPPEPAWDEPAAEMGSPEPLAATIPVTVSHSGTQQDVTIPLQITVQGQQVHLTLRLTLDVRLPG